MKLTRSQIIGLVITIIVAVIGITFAAAGESLSPADALLRQAYELRQQARRAHCTTIGQKIVACYTDPTAKECDTIAESSTWFLNEYGQTHDVACPSEDLPFGVGGR